MADKKSNHSSIGIMPVSRSEKPNFLENVHEEEIDLRALADKVYELLKRELRLEQQRVGQSRY